MLLLRMVASGDQSQSSASKFKRAISDVAELSKAVFPCRQTCIEACKGALAASEWPPLGFWEANWEHFITLKQAEDSLLDADIRLIEAHHGLMRHARLR